MTRKITTLKEYRQILEACIEPKSEKEIRFMLNRTTGRNMLIRLVALGFIIEINNGNRRCHKPRLLYRTVNINPTDEELRQVYKQREYESDGDYITQIGNRTIVRGIDNRHPPRQEHKSGRVYVSGSTLLMVV